MRSLSQVIEWRGKPAAIRCDNVLEYISGKPQQNAYIERYNRTVRYDPVLFMSSKKHSATLSRVSVGDPEPAINPPYSPSIKIQPFFAD